MSRLSVTLSSLALTMSLAPMAHAYATEPGTITLSQSAYTGTAFAEHEGEADNCSIAIVSSLVALVGAQDFLDTPSDGETAAIACAEAE